MFILCFAFLLNILVVFVLEANVSNHRGVQSSRCSGNIYGCDDLRIDHLSPSGTRQVSVSY